MERDIECWNYDIVKKFHTEHYTGIIEDNDLKEELCLKFKIGVDAAGKPITEQIKGWLIIRDKKKYLLPKEIGGKDIQELLPLKIKETMEFAHSTKIYHKPTPGGLTLFCIPAEKTMTARQWFDKFAPFRHSNPLHWKIYKLMTLGSLFVRVNSRVASPPAFGKDSLPTILSNLLPLDVGIYTPKSAPRLMTMLERRLLIINEIVDVKKEDMSALEPVIRIAGDMRPMVENSALAVQGLTKSSYDISHLSIGFIYNELWDYAPPRLKEDKTGKYFDNAFTNATNQRFLPLLLKGELDMNQFQRPDLAKYLYTEDLKNWVKMAKFLINGGFEELLAQKKSLCWRKEKEVGSRNGRLNYHFNSLLDIFRVYAMNEDEFNELADEAHKCFADYVRMVTENKDKVAEEWVQ